MADVDPEPTPDLAEPAPAVRVPGGGPVHRELRRASSTLPPRHLAALTLAVGLVVCGLFAAGAGAIYDQVDEGDGLAALDQPVLRAVMADRTPWLTDVARVLAFVGGPIGMPVLAVVVLSVLSLRRRSWVPLALGVVTGAGSVLVTVVGKAHIARARPPLRDALPPFEHSFSFPSGHALNAMAMSALVAYLLVGARRTTATRLLVAVLAGAFAVLMGLSRVYLGAHWLTDVLVGWALGLAWVAVVVTAHRWYRATEVRRSTP